MTGESTDSQKALETRVAKLEERAHARSRNHPEEDLIDALRGGVRDALPDDNTLANTSRASTRRGSYELHALRPRRYQRAG
jgi:hypothetical protein